MRFLSYWTLICLLMGLSLGDLSAADTQQAVAEIASGEEMHAMEGADGHAEGEHHGLPPAAVPIFQLGPIVVTNSMVVSFAVALILIIGAQLATSSELGADDQYEGDCKRNHHGVGHHDRP